MKTPLFVLAALLVFAFAAAQASAFTYDYHTYVLGYGDVSHGYTDTQSSTYNKITTSTDTPWGSQDQVSITKSSTDSFQPNYPSNSNYYFSENNNGFQPIAYSGWQNNHDVVSVRYYDPLENPNTIYPTNWRYQNVYYASDYPDANTYGYNYYYQPVYDWHSQAFNWAY